jgi:hypothetical protein
MEQMERFGVDRETVAFVLPTGYSFNLDGSSLYQSLALIFVAQVAGVHLGFSPLLVSKGTAGVARASLVVVLAVAAAFHLPSEPIFLRFGIDQFYGYGPHKRKRLGELFGHRGYCPLDRRRLLISCGRSSEGDFMMKLQTQGEDDCPSPRSRSDDYHALAFRAFLRQQCHKCPIHGRELAFLMDGKAQQVRIGHLLVTLQPSLERLNGLDEADLIRPEPMGGVIQIGTQKFHRFLRGYRIGRKGWIRNDSHESGLGERAGCPSLVGIPVEPMLRLQVSFMGGPKQRDQDIHV